jgi:hypothetical protein
LKKKNKMQAYQIIILALSLAFYWTEVLRWGVTKPFNCIKCMTGWFALIIACTQFGWFGILYAPVGVFAGAIFTMIKYRWL